MVDGEIDGPERLRCSTNLLMSVKERTHLSQRCERYCRGDNVFGFGGEAVVAAQGACELRELRERQLAGELRSLWAQQWFRQYVTIVLGSFFVLACIP